MDRGYEEPDGTISVTNPWSVAVLQWPEQADEAHALAAAGRPRLLLVAPDAEPPIDWHPMSDWLRRPANPLDVLLRIENLQRRADATETAVLRLDPDGILRRGRNCVVLAPAEVRLMGALLKNLHRVVGRTDLIAAVWPDGAPGPRTLDGRLQHLRARITTLGLQILNVRQRGYVLTDEDPVLIVSGARLGT
jgi:hypothetical protein